MNQSASRNYAGPLLLIALLEALVGALALALGGGAARALAALPLVLVLPGLALGLALFPPGAIGRAERATLAVGLSLALVVLGGLALNLTPWGLRPLPWAILLGGVTLIAGGAGLLRARAARRAPTPAGGVPRRGGGLTIPQAALLALAAIVVGGALALTVRGARGQETVGFTQVWMVQAAADDPAQVRLGVSNREPATTQFLLHLAVEGQPRRVWTLQLASGETWEAVVALPTDIGPTSDVEAILYRADTPGAVYRRVKLGREP